MNNLKNAVGLLNAQAPEGEFLAYINPDEAKMLKDAGGSGLLTPQGIPSFRGDAAYRSGSEQSKTSAGGQGNVGSTADFGGGGGNNNNNNNNNNNTGGGGGNDNREQYSAVTQYTTTPQAMGTVDAEDEYLAPDIDHYKATQKAIKSTISDLDDRGLNLSDYDDLTKEQQEIYQTEMNRPGTTMLWRKELVSEEYCLWLRSHLLRLIRLHQDLSPLIQVLALSLCILVLRQITKRVLRAIQSPISIQDLDCSRSEKSSTAWLLLPNLSSQPPCLRPCLGVF